MVPKYATDLATGAGLVAASISFRCAPTMLAIEVLDAYDDGCHFKEKPMPALYPYRIFISHAWGYNEEYYKLENMFKGYPNFNFRNYSVPQHDPFDTNQKLAQKLLDQMNPTQVIIVLAGMYVIHSDWIQYEINEAVRLKKPIIGVRPWGQERVPAAVQSAATVMHGWNVGPIVQSIRDLA